MSASTRARSDRRPPLVVLVMGSDSDLPQVRPAGAVLAELGVPYEMRVLSAHRTPRATAAFAAGAARRGVKVVIAAAGGAAHLAGAIAAHTTLPVLGVPLASTALSGLDALLATVQMPAGVPVGTLAVGGAENAALLAAAILALGDPALARRLRARREALARGVRNKDRALDAG